MAVFNYTGVTIATPPAPTATGLNIVASQDVARFVSTGVVLVHPLNMTVGVATASVFPTASSATKHPKRP